MKFKFENIKETSYYDILLKDNTDSRNFPDNMYLYIENMIS
jgi:hypothetical protein